MDPVQQSARAGNESGIAALIAEALAARRAPHMGAKQLGRQTEPWREFSDKQFAPAARSESRRAPLAETPEDRRLRHGDQCGSGAEGGGDAMKEIGEVFDLS